MCSQVDNPVEKEYANRFAKEKSRVESKNARENILQFWRDNKDICDEAYNYYAEYENNKAKYVKEPIRLEKEKFQKHLKSRKILILTANSIERGVFIRWLSEKNGSPLETYMVGVYSYNIYNVICEDAAEIKEISIIHVSPGKTGEGEARRVINSTCKLFHPDYIIALGICYGFNKDRHAIGYVFLSERVTVFRVNYRDSEDNLGLEVETLIEKQPAHNLVQSIKGRLMYTMVQNFLSDKMRPIYSLTEFGRFLSIDSLISNTKVKQALYEQHSKTRPEPICGEMEGPGILQSDIVQEDNFSNWIIVKSMCDWGEMKNDLDPDKRISNQIKDSLQAFAMTNTCSVFEKILDDLSEV